MLDQATWQFINSFADWLSALGTIAAVVTALHLSRRSERRHLSVSNGYYRVLPSVPGRAAEHRYFQIRAVNDGLRDVVVQGVMWDWRPVIGRRRRFVMLTTTAQPSTPVPARLLPGDTATFLFREHEFEAGAGDLRQTVQSSSWPRFAVNRLRCGVYTTTGEEILGRVDADVRRSLLRPNDPSA